MAISILCALGTILAGLIIGLFILDIWDTYRYNRELTRAYEKLEFKYDMLLHYGTIVEDEEEAQN